MTTQLNVKTVIDFDISWQYPWEPETRAVDTRAVDTRAVDTRAAISQKVANIYIYMYIYTIYWYSTMLSAD